MELTESSKSHCDDGSSAVSDEKNASPAKCAETSHDFAINETPSPSDDELRHNFSQVNVRDEKTGEDSSPQKKRKHRRWKPRKRKWKPYYKLSWREKRELEDREGKRATRIRAERFAHGQPVAPYNTTQFLMEDHNNQEPDLKPVAGCHRHHSERPNESSDEFVPEDDEEEFLQKEFTEIYNNIHAERLSAMSKIELIQEYLQLEDKEEKLARKLRRQQHSVSKEEDVTHVDWDQDMLEHEEKMRIFNNEIEKLVEQNKRLREENRMLRNLETQIGCLD